MYVNGTATIADFRRLTYTYTFSRPFECPRIWRAPRCIRWRSPRTRWPVANELWRRAWTSPFRWRTTAGARNILRATTLLWNAVGAITYHGRNGNKTWWLTGPKSDPVRAAYNTFLCRSNRRMRRKSTFPCRTIYATLFSTQSHYRPLVRRLRRAEPLEEQKKKLLSFSTKSLAFSSSP